MKKILMIFDGQHFSNRAFEFVRQLNRIQPISITGLFLPSIDYTSTMVYYFGIEASAYYPMLDKEDDLTTANIQKFRSLCESDHITFTIHDKIAGTILEGIRMETRYADVLILANELFYSNLGSGTQRQYLNETTHTAECPILLLPERCEFPRSIVLAYDGSDSSVFAIKQFAYLFPHLTTLKTILVYASPEGDIPHLDDIKEFASAHFSMLSVLQLNVDPKKYFATWLNGVGPALLVSGAYGRPLMSELFKKSFVGNIVKSHSLPVFVAHK